MEHADRVNRRWTLAAGVALLLGAGIWGGLEAHDALRFRQTQAWCEEVAAAVEDHRASTGRLPASLDDLEELPPRPFLVSDELQLSDRVDGDLFTIEFFVRSEDSNDGTFHVLEGEDHSWRSHGYIGPG